MNLTHGRTGGSANGGTLTIRDLVAIEAMAADLIGIGTRPGFSSGAMKDARRLKQTLEQNVAQRAYAFADAMLAEREVVR